MLQQHGTPGTPYRITDEARRRLLQYHWPGNVRELGNVIQRALVLCPDRTLTEEHLLFDDDVFGQDAVQLPAKPSQTGPDAQAETPPVSGHGFDGCARPTHAEEPMRDSAGESALESRASTPQVLPAQAQPLPASLHETGETAWTAPAAAASGGAGLQWAVRHSELRVIQDAIRSTKSREAAARLLGISPRTLRYKLAQMRDLGMMAAESAA